MKDTVKLGLILAAIAIAIAAIAFAAKLFH